MIIFNYSLSQDTCYSSTSCIHLIHEAATLIYSCSFSIVVRDELLLLFNCANCNYMSWPTRTLNKLPVTCKWFVSEMYQCAMDTLFQYQHNLHSLVIKKRPLTETQEFFQLNMQHAHEDKKLKDSIKSNATSNPKFKHGKKYELEVTTTQ